MPSFSLLIPLLVALLAVAAYFLGLTDRPPFVASSGPNYYAIVAVTDDKDIGGNIMRLLEGTAHAIRKQSDANLSLLQQAAAKYGAPEGADLISVGLFLDNPAVEKPRWAAGYLIDAESWEHAQAMASQIPSLPEPVRAVRIVQTSVLRARIPWRTVLTPMVAPHLHWRRALSAYQSGGHSATCGRHSSTFEASMPCTYGIEVYVTGPQGTRAWIDYVLVTGDTTLTLDDLYPEEAATSQMERQEEEQVHREEAAAEPVHHEEEGESEAPTTAESGQEHEHEHSPPEEADRESGRREQDSHEEEADEEDHYHEDEEHEEDYHEEDEEEDHFEHSPDYEEEKHEDFGSEEDEEVHDEEVHEEAETATA